MTPASGGKELPRNESHALVTGTWTSARLAKPVTLTAPIFSGSNAVRDAGSNPVEGSRPFVARLTARPWYDRDVSFRSDTLCFVAHPPLGRYQTRVCRRERCELRKMNDRALLRE